MKSKQIHSFLNIFQTQDDYYITIKLYLFKILNNDVTQRVSNIDDDYRILVKTRILVLRFLLLRNLFVIDVQCT